MHINYTFKYLQMIKRRQSDTRQRTQLRRQVKSLQALNQTADTAAIIHSLQLIRDDNDNTISDSDSEYEDDELSM